MTGLSWALLGAALSTALGCIGSAIGVATAGKAASGVVSEKPKLFGKVLLLQVLPGSQGLYGLLVSIFLLNKIGLLQGGAADFDKSIGLQLFAGGIAMGLSGLGSAIFQGKVAASSIMMTGKNPSLSGKGLIMTAMVETYAILGLLISILMINAISL